MDIWQLFAEKKLEIRNEKKQQYPVPKPNKNEQKKKSSINNELHHFVVSDSTYYFQHQKN